MRDSFTRSISPLWAWFAFVDLLAALVLIGYWIRVYSGPLWFSPGITEVAGTILFVVSNALLFRYRTVGGAGLLASAVLLAKVLLFVKG